MLRKEALSVYAPNHLTSFFLCLMIMCLFLSSSVFWLIIIRTVSSKGFMKGLNRTYQGCIISRSLAQKRRKEESDGGLHCWMPSRCCAKNFIYELLLSNVIPWDRHFQLSVGVLTLREVKWVYPRSYWKDTSELGYELRSQNSVLTSTWSCLPIKCVHLDLTKLKSSGTENINLKFSHFGFIIYDNEKLSLIPLSRVEEQTQVHSCTVHEDFSDQPGSRPWPMILFKETALSRLSRYVYFEVWIEIPSFSNYVGYCASIP